MIPRRLAAAVQLGTISLAAIAAFAAPPRAFLDGPYAGSFYAALQPAITGFTNRIPFSVADALIVATLAGVTAFWVTTLRRSSGVRRLVRLVLGTASLVAVLYIWFLVAWGWNYLRPSFSASLPKTSAALDETQLIDLEERLARALDALAPAAHAEHERDPDRSAAMASARSATLHLVGIDHTVTQTVPKHTLLDGYFDAVGISGMFFPFTFETLLANDLLWFEYPFTLQHEWGHVAGVARESDANFVAALATLDSGDDVLRYSGLLMVYSALPRTRADRRLSRLVLSDYAAIRRRDRLRINPFVSKLAWGTYDRYLKSQHVRTGLVNYSEYARLLLETDLGRSALSRALSFGRAPGRASSLPLRPGPASRPDA